MLLLCFQDDKKVLIGAPGLRDAAGMYDIQKSALSV